MTAPLHLKQTSKQVKAAYKQNAGKLTDIQMRQIQRGVELDRRAAMIREKEDRKKQNKRKREVKARKEEEARKQLGISVATQRIGYSHSQRDMKRGMEAWIGYSKKAGKKATVESPETGKAADVEEAAEDINEHSGNEEDTGLQGEPANDSDGTNSHMQEMLAMIVEADDDDEPWEKDSDRNLDDGVDSKSISSDETVYDDGLTDDDLLEVAESVTTHTAYSPGDDTFSDDGLTDDDLLELDDMIMPEGEITAIRNTSQHDRPGPPSLQNKSIPNDEVLLSSQSQQHQPLENTVSNNEDCSFDEWVWDSFLASGTQIARELNSDEPTTDTATKPEPQQANGTSENGSKNREIDPKSTKQVQSSPDEFPLDSDDLAAFHTIAEQQTPSPTSNPAAETKQQSKHTLDVSSVKPANRLLWSERFKIQSNRPILPTLHAQFASPAPAKNMGPPKIFNHTTTTSKKRSASFDEEERPTKARKTSPATHSRVSNQDTPVKTNSSAFSVFGMSTQDAVAFFDDDDDEF